MIKVPNQLDNKQSFRIKKKRFHMVEYTSTHENLYNDVHLTDNAIVYIVEGVKRITQNNHTVTILPQQLFLVPKGHYIMSEYLPENGSFRSIMLFFNGHQTAEILTSIGKMAKTNRSVLSTICVANATPQIVRIFDSIADIYSEKNIFAKNLLDIKIKELIYQLLSTHNTRNETIQFLQHTSTQKHNTLAEVIKNKLYESISLEELSQMCNMSVSTFKRAFVKEFHTTPMQWIMDRKLEKALWLIQTTDNPITEIAYICGFENYTHFSRRFKSKYGKSGRDIRTEL